MEVSYFKELYKSNGYIKKIGEVVDDIKSGTRKNPSDPSNISNRTYPSQFMCANHERVA
jgi:hypothetical protein